MDEAPDLTGPELRAELERLGISRAEFARICGVQWKAVNFWCMDPDDPRALPIPQYAVTIVRLLGETRRGTTITRLLDERSLLDEKRRLEDELEQARTRADELEVRCAALSAKLANARKQKAAATRKWQSEVRAQRKQEAA